MPVDGARHAVLKVVCLAHIGALQRDMIDVNAAFGEDFLRSRYDNPIRRYQRTANRSQPSSMGPIA